MLETHEDMNKDDIKKFIDNLTTTEMNGIMSVEIKLRTGELPTPMELQFLAKILETFDNPTN